jgi:hypothetical protein
MNLTINPQASGLSTVFKAYQEEALRCFWENEGKGLTSKIVHTHVTERLGSDRAISRSAIIVFLRDMADEGVLDYVEEPGLGGYHRVYSTKFNESGFKRALVDMVLSSLMRDFPEETKKVLQEYLD